MKLPTQLKSIAELRDKSRNHMLLLQNKMKIWMEWTISFVLLCHTVYKEERLNGAKKDFCIVLFLYHTYVVFCKMNMKTTFPS